MTQIDIIFLILGFLPPGPPPPITPPVSIPPPHTPPISIPNCKHVFPLCSLVLLELGVGGRMDQ